MRRDVATAPDASIIIAAYRAESSIAEAVASALTQRDVDLEVIVVDDASPDETSAVVIAIGDPRVRCFRLQRNCGPATARNRGFAEARGTWIAVLDADDVMLPERLRRLIDFATAEEADAVIDDLLVETNSSPTRRMFGSALAGTHRIELASYMRSNRLFGRGHNLGYAKPLFRKDFLRARGISYDESLRIGEDYQLMADCLAAGAHVSVLDAALYCYRRHGSSISHRLEVGAIEAMLAADERFARRWPLDGAARAALRARAAAFRNGVAFVRAVDALKARKFWSAAAQIARRPAAALEFRRPVGTRLRKIAVSRRRRAPN